MQNAHNNISNMIISDLRLYGVDVINKSVYVNKKLMGSIPEFVAESKKNYEKMESDLHSLWMSIPLFLAEDPGLISDAGRRLLSSSMANITRKIKSIPALSEINVISSISEANMDTFDRWSDKTAEDMSSICIKIENTEHKIRKTAFIVASILYLNHELKKTAQTNGTSVQGPYSNLDLPVAERWYLWGDVSDEVDGRRDSIRSSRRYQMGLEDADPLSVKEGFYWRELRNDPYKFDTLYPDSPYPYRSALWGNP